MRCPHCAAVIVSPSMRWQQQQRARGRCIACGARVEKVAGHEFARCLACRVKDAERRARHRDVDVMRDR
jgi:DNA-directed RNA polymerase subunit RPC12/RpoP